MQSQAIAQPLKTLRGAVAAESGTQMLTAGWFTGLLLAVIPCLPLAGILLIAQVLPQIEAAFAATPGVKILAPMALAVPSLMLGLFSLPAGWLTDRTGRARLLLTCLALYGFLGIAPVFLHNLHAIIFARAAMGIAGAGIMTASTALVGDHYTGIARARWLSLRTSIAAAAAIGFSVLGGYLGEISWRAPFWFFTSGFVLFVLAAMVIRDRPELTRPQKDAAERLNLPWRGLAGPCVFGLVMAFGIYATQIEMPLLMHHIGIKAPHRIGIAASFTHLGSMLGTLTYAFAARLDQGRGAAGINFAITLIVALGLVLLGLTGTYDLMALGGFIACYGGGIGFPCMINRVLRALAIQQYGIGIGVWQSCFNIGVFLVPMTILALAARSGGLGHGVALAGALSGMISIIQLIFLRLRVPRGAAA